MLNRSQKEEIVKEVNALLTSSKAVFITNVVGMPSVESVKLRADIRSLKGQVVVTKNTLFKLAAEKTAAEDLLKNLSGPHALVFANESGDPAAIAKALNTAIDAHPCISFKGGILDGKIISGQEVKQLAGLPSRDQMLGTLLATFMAPVSAFARVLHAVKEQKEQQSA